MSTPVSLDEMVTRLERALASSPADSTELVWVEAHRSQESNGKRRRETYEQRERTVFVRVREAGRYGIHRSSACGASDLENAIRDALAQARFSFPPAAALATPAPRPEGADGPLAGGAGLHDPEVAHMTPARARELVQDLAEHGETVRLGWAEGRVAVANSRGLRRTAEVTSAWAAVSTGQGPGAGLAAAASRSLAGLGPSTLLARAQKRQAPEGETVACPDGPVPVVLSQEAVAGLLELLNRRALTSASFHHGTSSLRGALGKPVFHPAITLRDDGTDPRGLPFPFDLLGAAKRPLDLIAQGVFLTPAVDERLARELDRPTTPHLVAPDEAAPSHLFLVSREPSADGELLGGADGGLWISALDPVEGFDPGSLRFRATARGVRRIERGALGAPVSDLVWEDDLATLLAGRLEVGKVVVTLAQGDRLFGGITAPLLALESVSGLLRAP